VGTVIEKEGPFRWRVRSAGTNGGNRFGHGATAAEAVDNYILGHSVITTEQAGAERFHEYPKSVQREIEERDAAVAQRQGRSVEDFPEVIARREFKANQKAAAGAKPIAPGQTSDGAEVASAQLEAGAKRGGRRGSPRPPRTARAHAGAPEGRLGSRNVGSGVAQPGSAPDSGRRFESGPRH
jgi:hypothetical protein